MPITATEEKPEPEPEDWRQDEQLSHSNLQFFKTQQWHVTNYGFLLLGGLFYIKDFIRDLDVAGWLPIIVAAAGSFVVWELEATLDRARKAARCARCKRGLPFARDPRGLWRLSLYSVSFFLTLALMVGSALVSRALSADISWCLALLAPAIGGLGGGLWGWLARRGAERTKGPSVVGGKPEPKTVNLREMFKVHYDLADRLRRRSMKWIDDGTLPPAKTSPEHESLKFFVIRAHTTFTAGIHLCEGGFAIASVMLIRNLVEELITLRYILSNPGTTERYADRLVVIEKRTLDKVLELDETYYAASLKNRWRKEEPRIESENDRIRQKYAKDFDPERWAGKKKSLKQLAKDTGSSDLYNYFYSVGSDIVHGSVRSAEYFMRDEGGALVFYPGPTESLQRDALMMLSTVFPLFWDEVSILSGRPTWEELKRVAENEHFEHLSRNPRKHSGDSGAIPTP